ncbi:hypothetical protein BLNAU_5017 [Blattamonas nauphoetae]|uniref:Uncharacterized protein n=1 Tax=Blattamonas nauphoetae TaxID=2049346 RepID=A0ABQ9Y8X3_9EUKA|nr:hypothetical protein BLNAU_5017 [Blattamonas nauphoetae]
MRPDLAQPAQQRPLPPPDEMRRQLVIYYAGACADGIVDSQEIVTAEKLSPLVNNESFHSSLDYHNIGTNNSCFVHFVHAEYFIDEQWDDPTQLSMEKETNVLNPSLDACLSVTSELPSTVTPEEEPFLTFDPNAQLSFTDKSSVYCSLVALVKTDYPFDKALQDRAVRFLKSLEPKWDEQDLADKLVTDMIPSSAGPLSGFIASILTLLSSPHSSVVAEELSFLRATTRAASPAIRDCLMESDLVSKVLAAVQPHTLQISGNEKRIVPCVFLAFPSSLMDVHNVSVINKFKNREMILQKVVLPSSQFLTYLISKRYHLAGKLFDTFMSLLTTHLRIGPFHRPTLDFVLASPIAMAFSSCLSFGNGGYDIWIPLMEIDRSLSELKREGSEVALSGKRMMQALFSEGFEDIIEQMSMLSEDGSVSESLTRTCHTLLQGLGSNVPRQ